MGVLVIDKTAKAQIQKVIAFAKLHRVSVELLEKMRNKEISPVGDCDDYACFLERGFRVVYSIEEQPCGYCHHLSVSVGNGKYPNVNAVQMIMEEFGMIPDVKKCIVCWDEKNVWTPQGKIVNAINILQLYEENDNDKKE